MSNVKNNSDISHQVGSQNLRDHIEKLDLNGSKPRNTGQDEQKIITVQQARFRYSICVTRLYELMKTDLGPIKIGRRTYLKVNELDALVDRSTVRHTPAKGDI